MASAGSGQLAVHNAAQSQVSEEDRFLAGLATKLYSSLASRPNTGLDEVELRVALEALGTSLPKPQISELCMSSVDGGRAISHQNFVKLGEHLDSFL
jgi:hypothetical protein